MSQCVFDSLSLSYIPFCSLLFFFFGGGGGGWVEACFCLCLSLLGWSAAEVSGRDGRLLSK